MGNVTVITGGTSGIGRAIVEKIAEHSSEGDKIIVNYGHNDQNARQLLISFEEELRSRIILIREDLSKYENIDPFCKKIKEKTDHIDWLVLNTGVGTYLPFEEYTFDLWDNIMRTNLSVPAFLIRELSELMAVNGNVILMASHAGQVPYSSSVVYGVTKAGLIFLARTLVKVLEKRRVSINAIAPGFIETRWQDGRSEESYERINKKIALHRFGEPSEVADLCWSVLNNDYLNGSVFEVHGGYNYF
ncbi:MAG: SDR family oxidoreductase [Eubacterium sp.]|nr:SDR family oxidoreductase [Eubacterium sp.]